MSAYQKATGSCVLHITITHLIYPVTEEVLDQLFHVYGVHDLCVSQKSTHMEVFVEFQSWLEASQARGALHGRCIYDGCCLLDIQHATPSISVITLPNSKPVVVDFDCVEMATVSIAIDVSSLASPTPTTCSMEGPSHDATAPTSTLTSATTPTSSTTIVDIFPELAAPAVGDEAIDIDISILELDTMVPTRCSTLCFDNDIGMRTPAFQLDVTPSIKQRGQMIRPSPWPSFIAEHTSTARSSIVEPPLSVATASSRDVVPYSALPPFPSTTWPRNEIRVKLCITALDVFLVSSYLDTVGFCASLQVMVLEDISHKKGCQGELDFRPPPNSKTGNHQPLGQAEEIGDNKPSCGSITVYPWLVYNEYVEVPRATTHSKVLQFPSNLSNSPSMMWCLDDVFWRCKNWWSHTQYEQPASTIVEAHSQSLRPVRFSILSLTGELNFCPETTYSAGTLNGRLVQPAHPDCLRPPAEPPDSCEGCETMLSYDQFTLRGVRGISHQIPTTEFVFNCYSLEVRNEYSSESTICSAITNCDTYLAIALLVGFVCKFSPKDSSTSPARMQVTGYSHVCQHCRRRELFRGVCYFLRTSDQEMKLNYNSAAGEQVMRLCYVKLRPWPYSVLHFIEPCNFWLGIQRFVSNGRLASEVEFSTTNMALLPRNTTQLQSWPPHPCIQCTVLAHDRNSWFNS